MDTNKVINYYKNGNTCSQALIKVAIEKGYCPKDFLPAATAFSGGMSSGCVCGAVASAQMIVGYCLGEIEAKNAASIIVKEFKEKNKVTCCRILSGGLTGIERKEHCSKYLVDVCEILNNLIKVKV